MKKALKAKWITALRSGEYKQTDNVLRRGYTANNEEAFCCLGVLGRICGVSNERLDAGTILDDVGLDGLLGPWGNNDGYIAMVKCTHKSIQQRLAGMNDAGRTFKQIAAWIEKNVPPKPKAKAKARS